MTRLVSLVTLVICLSLGAAPIDFKFDPNARRPVQKIPPITDPFLLENAKREEVTVLPSGLQIEIIETGYGRLPTIYDEVLINYNGWLSDGFLFDSSYKRGKPATFPVSGVVPGFSEGLQNIRMGGKAKIYMPGYLGYGKKGSGGVIPPDATLIFEIEVLDVIE